MGMLKSLGLVPAKRAGTATGRAFRRLFGRVLPGAEGDGAATGNDEYKESGHSNLNESSQSIDQNNSIQVRDSSDRDNANNAIHQNEHVNFKEIHHDSTPALIDIGNHDRQISTTTVPDSENMTTLSQQQLNQARGIDKENRPPIAASLEGSLSRLSLKDKDNAVCDDGTPLATEGQGYACPIVTAERAMHMHFTEEALDMARLALKTNETPVGCVLVHDGKVIARGMNATNVSRNGTRHAELMALCALLSHPPGHGPRTTCLKPKVDTACSTAASSASSACSAPPDEGNEDGSKGHLYPYGQKCHPAERVDKSIIQESILYVTVEPCVMCASLLRQLGIKKVYFGAVNDKFGGTGGVFSIHANSLPISADGQTAAAHPTPKPSQLPDSTGTLGVSFPPGGGDGGNIEAGYEIEGGWGRDEAVALLRRFYVQENGRAPVPRKKEGRAARLAAMMKEDGEDPATATAAGSEADGEGMDGDRVEGEKTDLPTSTEALEEAVSPIKVVAPQLADITNKDTIPMSKSSGNPSTEKRSADVCK